MEAIELISQDLFDKVRSRFSNLEMGDESGSVTKDPREARFFDFDFVIEEKKLGRVSVSINERGTLKIFYSQGILEDADPISQQLWFNFLREMRLFAKRRLMRFDTRDITKSNLNKNDFQYLATTGTKEENMSESRMYGTPTRSILPILEKVRVVIRHTDPVDEMQRGARSRKIKAIYIENKDGERWKCPINSLRYAKAIGRHVANEGRPWDECGEAITKIAEEIAKLNAFRKHVGKPDSMQGEANQIMDRTCAKLDELRHQLDSLSKQRYYEQWKETFQPVNHADEMVLDNVTMENYKNAFTINSFKEDLTQYFPLIHSIMQEAGEVDLETYVQEGTKETCEVCHKPVEDCECKGHDHKKEGFEAFEEWAEAVENGKLDDDTFNGLKDLFDKGMMLGVNAVNSVESLEQIGIRDQDLENALEALSKVDSNADPKPTILSWLNKFDPESAKQLGHEEATAQEPADQQAAPVAQEPEAPADPAAAQQPAVPQGTEQDESRKDRKKEKKHNLRDIAQMVKSFYNKEDNTFPLGETGVAIKVEKEFGEEAGRLAEKLIHSLKKHSPRDDKTFEDILRLSGIKK